MGEFWCDSGEHEEGASIRPGSLQPWEFTSSLQEHHWKLLQTQPKRAMDAVSGK